MINKTGLPYLFHTGGRPSSSHICTARGGCRSRGHIRDKAHIRRRTDPASRGYTCKSMSTKHFPRQIHAGGSNFSSFSLSVARSHEETGSCEVVVVVGSMRMEQREATCVRGTCLNTIAVSRQRSAIPRLQSPRASCLVNYCYFESPADGTAA